MKLPIGCPIWNAPSLPKMKLPIGYPIWNPPSLPKMKLPIGCPIQNSLKHEYYRILIPMFLRLEGNVPPRNEKVGSQVNVTFWFWMMYPPLAMKKLDLRLMWHISSGWCTPPPPLIEINMNAIENNWGQQVLFTNLPPYSIILFYAWTGNWWISISIGYGYMDSNPIWYPSPAQKLKCSFLDYVLLLMISQASRWTQTPSATPLQPKNEMLIFGLHSTSDDWLSDPSKKHWPKRKKMKKAP